jgi:hypothetical protein
MVNAPMRRTLIDASLALADALGNGSRLVLDEHEAGATGATLVLDGATFHHSLLSRVLHHDANIYADVTRISGPPVDSPAYRPGTFTAYGPPADIRSADGVRVADPLIPLTEQIAQAGRPSVVVVRNQRKLPDVVKAVLAMTPTDGYSSGQMLGMAASPGYASPSAMAGILQMERRASAVYAQYPHLRIWRPR